MYTYHYVMMVSMFPRTTEEEETLVCIAREFYLKNPTPTGAAHVTQLGPVSKQTKPHRVHAVELRLKYREATETG